METLFKESLKSFNELGKIVNAHISTEISADVIENAVIEILKKYNVVMSDVTYMKDSTVGYRTQKIYGVPGVSGAQGVIGVQGQPGNQGIDGVLGLIWQQGSSESDKPKTFSLDEVINIIDSMKTKEENDPFISVFDDNYKIKIFIDKDELIKKFKSC
jgi:hypothetical protein